MLKRLFPLLAYQHIFQLEEYSPSRLISWWLKHPLQRSTTSKKPLVITSRVRFSLITSCLVLILIYLSSWLLRSKLLLSFAVFSSIFPFPLLIIAKLVSYIPNELISKNIAIKQTRQAILQTHNLITICITGSYGKTSTKDFLYTILKAHQTQTIKTPNSYNTPLGIAKVVRLELLSKTRFFICEMGAYIRGEIKNLTYEVPPQYSIITAIGNQHLERFKTLKNTTLAKFEIIDATRNKKNCLINLDNSFIRAHLKKQKKYSAVKTYSLKDKNADFFISKHSTSPSNTHLTITHKNKSYNFQSHLFGTSNLQNLGMAISMAMLLQVPIKTIQRALTQIFPSSHRMELKKIRQATLIDNAFSSNPQGFKQIIHDLQKIKGKKAIITPGIIELGKGSNKIHQQLGKQIAKVFDTIILVGHSSRTENLKRGIGKRKISYIKTKSQILNKINKLAQNHSWILLENDLPDNY